MKETLVVEYVGFPDSARILGMFDEMIMLEVFAQGNFLLS